MEPGQRGLPVAIANKEDIIRRVANGEKLRDIAKSYGLTTHNALSKYLASDPDYQDARASGLESRMDQRESELEIADDSVTVARARELLSHARWRAERECPQRWGQKQEITHHNHSVDIKSLLDQREARLNTIDSTCKVVDVSTHSGS